MKLGYRLGWWFVYGVSKLLWRIRVEGSERIPRHGPVVIAPSHRSNLDVFYAPLVTTRRCRFMAKREVWKSRLLGRLAEYFGAFPVTRGEVDRAALRTSTEVLEAGEPLVVYPEGTRREGPVIEDLHDGAAYLAARLGVPIVPVGIGGTERILGKGRKIPRLHRVQLVVGEPIAPPRRGAAKRSEVRALTADLEVALQKTFDEAQALLRS